MRLLTLLATLLLLTIFESSARSAGGGGHGAAGAGHGSGEGGWGYNRDDESIEPIIAAELEEIPKDDDMDLEDDELDSGTVQRLIRLLQKKDGTSSEFDDYTLRGAGTNEIIHTVKSENDSKRDALAVKTLKAQEHATTEVARAKSAAHQAYRKAGCSLSRLDNPTNEGLSKECTTLKREFNKQAKLLDKNKTELKRLRTL